jgi:general secretion pathway protein J
MPPRRRVERPSRASSAGFTLVEMLIALGLFALIGMAGLSLLDGVLRAQERTDGRLARLGELERAMHLVTLDFEQADPRSLSFENGTVGLSTRGRTGVRYAFRDGRLERAVGGATQILIADVAGIAWAFHLPGAGWRDDAPGADEKASPDAVALTVTLGDGAPGPRGVLRRMVELSAAPPVDPLGGLGP